MAWHGRRNGSWLPRGCFRFLALMQKRRQASLLVRHGLAMLDGALQWPTIGLWRDLRRCDKPRDHRPDMPPDGVIVHGLDDRDGGMCAAIFT
jgi:hypothetical protein